MIFSLIFSSVHPDIILLVIYNNKKVNKYLFLKSVLFYKNILFYLYVIYWKSKKTNNIILQHYTLFKSKRI